MNRPVRMGYKVAARVRTMYWFVFRPVTSGVKCVIRHDGRWLMIRNSYGKGHWTFPGGKVERGEDPADAAIREVREEVGISLGSVEPIGSFFNDRQYKRDTVYCFVAEVMNADHRIDEHEVVESAWYLPDEIPSFRGRAVDEIRRLLTRP